MHRRGMQRRDWLALASLLARIAAAILALLLVPVAVSAMFEAVSLRPGLPPGVVVRAAGPEQVAAGVGTLLLLAAMLLCTWWVTRR